MGHSFPLKYKLGISIIKEAVCSQLKRLQTQEQADNLANSFVARFAPFKLTFVVIDGDTVFKSCECETFGGLLKK
jgi:hypothetical protein